MKTRNLIVFIIITLVVLIGMYAILCGVKVGSKEFNPLKGSFAGAEYQGESMITLISSDGENLSDKEKADAIRVISKRLDLLGFKYYEVQSLDDNGIVVTLPLNETSDFRDAQQIASNISITGNLYITEKNDPSKVLITRDMIKTVELQVNTLNKYSIFLMMNDEGKKELAKVTDEIASREKEADKYIRIMYDDTQLSETSIRKMFDEYIGYSSSDNQYKAETFKNIIDGGMLPKAMKVSSIEELSAKGSIDAKQNIRITLLVVLILTTVVLSVLYRMSGLITSITAILYVDAALVLLCLFGIQYNVMTYAALILGYVLTIFGQLITHYDFVKEMKAGRSHVSAYGKAYRKSVPFVTNTFIAALFIFVVMVGCGISKFETAAFAVGTALVTAYICVLGVSFVLNKLATGFVKKNEVFYSIKMEEKKND